MFLEHSFKEFSTLMAQNEFNPSRAKTGPLNNPTRCHNIMKSALIKLRVIIFQYKHL